MATPGASPQLDNGYVMIANELFDALIRVRIPGEQRQVLDFIIRKTYGWRKKSDAIPLSQFVKATGIKKSNISRALNILKNRQIIAILKKGDREPVIYGINKDYTKWRLSSKKRISSKKSCPILKKDNNLSSKKSTSKDTTKDTNQKTKEIYKETFLTFLKKYPGTKNKDYAFTCWEKNSKDRPPLKEILTAIQNQILERKEKADANIFVPPWKNASTWINQHCWNDVIDSFEKPDEWAAFKKRREAEKIERKRGKVKNGV